MPFNSDDRSARSLLRELFDIAVASADPAKRLADVLPTRPVGRCIVVGAGKAAARMATALEAAWSEVPLSGLVVTRDGHAEPTKRIEVIEAAHPIPDARSADAGQRMLQMVAGLTSDDLVIALISGGGSATLVAPGPGLTLDDKIAVHRALLHSGASIGEMNLVRGTLSAIKAGRLAAAASPARVVTLVVSDVPGDDPAQIASGPTIGLPAAKAAAQAVVRRYQLSLPAAVETFLITPEPATAAAIPADVRIVAAPSLALEATRVRAEQAGLTTIVLGDAIEGEAREVAKVLAGIASSVRTHALPARAPLILLSGGETSVTIGKSGARRGGRNTEFLLALALALRGAERVWALAADTDGIDGSEDAAGAIVTPDTLERALAQGLDPAALLDAHDSYTFFSRIGDLVMTGPTGTNVNDFRAILIA